MRAFVTPSDLHARRNQAYFVALALHGTVAAVALIIWAAGINTPIANGTIATAMFVAGMIGAVMMMRAGCMLAVLPFFMIGCAVYFGLGTAIAVSSPAEMAGLSFTEDAQRETLAKVTAAHAVAALIAIACAGPFFVFMREDGTDGVGLRSILDSLGDYFGYLLALSIFACLLQWLTFPQPSSLVVASMLDLLRGAPLVLMIVTAAIWHRLDGQSRLLAILVMVSTVFYGLLLLTKLYTLLPIVTFALGFAIAGRNRAIVLALIVGSVAVYFGVLAELVRFGRGHINYDPELNTVAERIFVLVDTYDTSILNQGVIEDTNFLLRLSMVPFAAYFMNLYDTGFPGDSLDMAGAVLVPRFLWPEKPIFSAGVEFDLIWRGVADISSLAIGPVAEGYWNLGWPGVVLVSVLIGVQIGWFTRKWVLFSRYGVIHIGVFLMSPALIRAFGQVESNVVGAYIGGTVRTAIIIMMIDLIVRAYVGHRQARISDG